MAEQSSFTVNPLLSSLAPLSLKKNEQFIAELTAKGLEFYDFTLGDPREPTPDFIREALHDGITQVSQYPSTSGSLKLREAASLWMRRRFNVNVDAHAQIISSNGSKEAVFHVPQILVCGSSEKNIIAFPQPAYPIYKTGAVLSGGRLCEIPLKESNNFVLNLNDIPTNQIPHIAALWVCYPHNPTGATISYEQAHKIYEWCLKHNITLLSDECYIDTYFNNQIPLSFLEIAQTNKYQNLLCFFSLSKRSGMTGYRSGVVAGDSNLIQTYIKYRYNIGSGTPDFIQHAAIAAWNDSAHVKERNKVFYEKRKIVEEFFEKNKIEFLKSEATFYIWGTIPTQYSTALEYTEKLKNLGLFMTPGSAFGENYEQYFRLALVPTCEQIKNALIVWQNALDKGML